MVISRLLWKGERYLLKLKGLRMNINKIKKFEYTFTIKFIKHSLKMQSKYYWISEESKKLLVKSMKLKSK